ncbi:siderophore ABC transporter substrate-binding protein [Acinetobacter baumannii]|uniref:siderophore ABC transporter substrate-binding protein n=1 Tax=Acinetobacter TaxID=469 RepID=UPI00125F43E7|nr:siderophore ABC transporter substrate-binding protein [Acinetobacter soli]
MNWKQTAHVLTLAICSAMALTGCTKPTPDSSEQQILAEPIVIQHKLGTMTLNYRPQRIAVLDMNDVDFLDVLNVPIAGMVKDFVPDYLQKYKNNPNIQDLGAIVQPNMERIYSLKPDLILMTPNQTNHYQELTELAPTLHFDIDYGNSRGAHLDIIRQHLLTLGKIFDKENLAQQKLQEFNAKVAQIHQLTQNRPEKALIVMHNNGAFSSFGVKSRYGFVFDALGVKPASTVEDSSLHGQPISSEFIQQANPDILYVIDRTAVMEHRPAIDMQHFENPLLRQTKAWKTGRVVFVDADAWYVAAASPTSIEMMIEDVKKGYQP